MRPGSSSRQSSLFVPCHLASSVNTPDIMPGERMEAIHAVFADRSSSRAGELDGQAAMHLCIAFIALVAVMMMGAVVEHVFVLSRGRRLVPGAFERSFLFAYVAVGFDRIGKIGVEFNLQV